MRDLEPNWDESALGFSKFSRFLRSAHDAEVINLRKIVNGSYEVALHSVGPRVQPPAEPPADAGRPEEKADMPAGLQSAQAIGVRRGSRSPRVTAPPPLLAGQAISVQPAPPRAPASEPVMPARPQRSAARLPSGGALADLPSEREAVIQYLTRSYKGVGRKTAETLVDAVGEARVFETLQQSPARVQEILGAKRGSALVQAWQTDAAARAEHPGGAHGADARAGAGDAQGPGRPGRGRRGGRRRGGRGRKRAPATDG
jgi:hypothetical protein